MTTVLSTPQPILRPTWLPALQGGSAHDHGSVHSTTNGYAQQLQGRIMPLVVGVGHLA